MKITLPTPIPITDHTQLTSIGTTTHAAIDAALSGYSEIKTDTHFITGFVNRTTSSISLSGQIFTIAPLGGTSFDVYVDGTKFTKTSTSVTIGSEQGPHYIYFDNTGTLQHGTGAWNIESAAAPVAIVFWNGAAGALYDERHSAMRNLAWHKWAHETIGTRYDTGLECTFSTTATSMAVGEIHDEDIEFIISSPVTHVRLFYRTSGAANMTFESLIGANNPCAKVASGKLQYDNGGTLTDVDNSKYIVNWIYATTDTTIPLMCVLSQAQYNTLALARNATLPSFPTGAHPSAELKLIYRTIWQGQSPSFVEATDYRGSSTLPAGGVSNPVAATVSFTPSGNIASTNVQAAIEEVDNEKSPVIHNLVDTTNHPVTGLTNGHFLKASGATTYGFAAHGLTAADVSAEPALGNPTSNGYVLSSTTLGVRSWVEGSSGGVGKVITAANSFNVGQVVYFDGANYQLAKADASTTLGLWIISAADAAKFTIQQAGYMSGLSGLTAGQYYYVSNAVAGALTSTAPISGYYNPLLFAISTTEGWVLPFKPSAVPTTSQLIAAYRKEQWCS